MNSLTAVFFSRQRDLLARKNHMFGLLLLCCAAAARAHSDEAVAGGFLSGYLHPLTGLDHLLAMVAVGIWGSTLGKPLVWVLPVVFPLLMVVGGVLGIEQVPLPYVSAGIACSVVVLGLSIAISWRAPIAAAMCIVAVFGALHGYAHGAELVTTALPAAYAAGFVVSTGLLHLAGISLGALKGVRYGGQLLRAGGSAIAAAGLWILAGMPGVA